MLIAAGGRSARHAAPRAAGSRPRPPDRLLYDDLRGAPCWRISGGAGDLTTDAIVRRDGGRGAAWWPAKPAASPGSRVALARLRLLDPRSSAEITTATAPTSKRGDGARRGSGRRARS